MRGIFFAAFLVTAVLGSLAGFFIPIEVLCIFGWVNFLVVVALVSAWSKPDAGLTVSIVVTSFIFWLSVYGGTLLMSV